MRFAAVPLALVAAACGPKHTTPADPPKIEVTCVLGADGASCNFRNAGGKGERCVVVLYGSKATGAVIASPRTCSGPLAKGATQTMPVAFARRPADVCGADLAPCTTKVVEPDIADDAALAWGDELAAAAKPTGPPTAAECGELISHIIDVMVKEYDPTGENRMREQYEQQRPYLIEECQQRWTRPQVDCVKKAQHLRDMEGCFRQ